MRYWKGLFIAAAFDAAMLAGPKVFAPEPLPVRLAVVELLDIDRQVDSLIARLQENAGDVDAMLAIARIYMERGWMDEAIGPLARALELDPYRRDLWVALDRALEGAGYDKITDEELMAAARAFAEMIGMEGHGC